MYSFHPHADSVSNNSHIPIPHSPATHQQQMLPPLNQHVQQHTIIHAPVYAPHLYPSYPMSVAPPVGFGTSIQTSTASNNSAPAPLLHPTIHHSHHNHNNMMAMHAGGSQFMPHSYASVPLPHPMYRVSSPSTSLSATPTLSFHPSVSIPPLQQLNQLQQTNTNFNLPARRSQYTVPMPLASGFYEQPTISSVLRHRPLHTHHTPVETVSVRTIDITSADSHHLSDASEVMLKPTLTKLNAYKEKHARSLTLHGPRKRRVDSPSTLQTSPSSPRPDSRAESISSFTASNISPRKLTHDIIDAVISPKNSRPATSIIRSSHLSPAPPITPSNGKGTFFPSPPQSQTNTPRMEPRSIPRHGIFFAPSMFPNSASLNFHPMNKHRHKRHKSLSAKVDSFPHEEAKIQSEQDDADTVMMDESVKRSPTGSSFQRVIAEVEWAGTAGSPFTPLDGSADDRSRSHSLSNASNNASTVTSHSVSISASPSHSRQTSTNQQMLQQLLSQHLRGQIAELEQVKKDEKPNEYVYLQPLVTASAYQHRKKESSGKSGHFVAGGETVTNNADGASVSSDSEATLNDGSISSDLPSVPEAGIALDSSLTSSQRLVAQKRLEEEKNDSVLPPIDPSMPPGSMTLATLQHDDNFNADDSSVAIEVSTNQAPQPKKFTMQDFWSMHDYGDNRSSDSEAEAATSDQFDSNPSSMGRASRLRKSRKSAGPQKFNILDDNSSSDSDEEARKLVQAKADADRMAGFDFITGSKKKKKGKKGSSDTGKDPPKKESPPVNSAAEMLKNSLNQLARAQMQQEFSLQNQKQKILNWFHKATQNVASKKKKQMNVIVDVEVEGGGEEKELSEQLLAKAAQVKVLKEKRRSRRLDMKKQREESEARDKVFAMLGGEESTPKASDSDSAPHRRHLSMLFTSSDQVMSYIEIEQLIQDGRGAVNVYKHLIEMEAAGDVKFDSPSQLISAVKVLSLPIESTNRDIVQHQLKQAHLPVNAERFVLKHSEVELEMHRVMKLSGARKRNSKRRSRALKQRAARNAQAQAVTTDDNLIMVVEGIEPIINPATGAVTSMPPPDPELLSKMKEQQATYEDQQAREELMDRLTVQENNVLFESEQMMTPHQVEQLIEVGKGSKPTLRHIVQMEVEKVKFLDPTQLISAVQVLTIPAELDYNEKLVNMDLIQHQVALAKLPDSAEKYVLKHSEVDIEMHKVEINLKRHSGNQMKFLMDYSQALKSGNSGNLKAQLTASGNRRFKDTGKAAKEAKVVLTDLQEDTSLTVELVDTTEDAIHAQVSKNVSADFFGLSPEEQEKERARIEDELARKEVHKRLLPQGTTLDPASALSPTEARRSSQLFVEGSVPMTPMQVDKLIEVGKGSKPTLRHIVQMEVERVKFEDPTQLIRAVKVLSVPIQSSNFNLEKIEHEITEGRVKLPPSAVEYVMKHSEVQLEMHQIERMGLAMSGNYSGGFNAMAADAKSVQQFTIEDTDMMMEEEEFNEESPEQLEQMRDEVARAEVHLRLENGRSKLFKADVKMSSLQVDELIEEGQGGQPTLRHIVEMEVDAIQFDSPQQLITAVKVMNLPNAKRNSGPMNSSDDPKSTSEKRKSNPTITKADVAVAAAEARLPAKITEYVLKHSEVQLEMAKVVTVATPQQSSRVATVQLIQTDHGMEDIFDEHDHVQEMRKQLAGLEREINILEADDGDEELLMEEVVMNEFSLEESSAPPNPNKPPTRSQTPSSSKHLQLPEPSAATQSRRQSLVLFAMTPEVVEEIIEETQAGDYVITHLEKLSREVDKKPFETKEELVKAVVEEHAAYMEVEEHARVEVHNRLEHDRPSSVFKLGTKMKPAQVEHLIDEGHGAVPTLKHIVRMEHSNVKFKEPSELVSAVKVLSMPLGSTTLETVSHSVAAAHLPPEASNYVMKVMEHELQMFEVDVEEVRVESGSARPRTAGDEKQMRSVRGHTINNDFRSTSPSMAVHMSDNVRPSSVAHFRVMSPIDDTLVEEEVGRSSRSGSRLGERTAEVSTRRAARNSGQLGPLILSNPSYMQGSALGVGSPALKSGARHSLGLPIAGIEVSPRGSPTQGNSLTNTATRKSLQKWVSSPPQPSSLQASPIPNTSPNQVRRMMEAELTMEADDPALMNRSPSRSQMSDSRGEERQGGANAGSKAGGDLSGIAHQHSIQLRPAISAHVSPAMSLHNTMNRAQLMQAMQEAEGNASVERPVSADFQGPPTLTRLASGSRASTADPTHGQPASLHLKFTNPLPSRGASPTDSSTLHVEEVPIRRFSLTSPLNISTDLKPGQPPTVTTPQNDTDAHPTPSARSTSPYPHLSVPLPHSNPNSLNNTTSDSAADATSSPISHSPSHSTIQMPFTVTVSEASTHASRAHTPLDEQKMDTNAAYYDFPEGSSESMVNKTMTDKARVTAPGAVPTIVVSHHSSSSSSDSQSQIEATKLDGFQLASAAEKAIEGKVKLRHFPSDRTDSMEADNTTPPSVSRHNSSTAANSLAPTATTPVDGTPALTAVKEPLGRGSESPKSPSRTSPHQSPPMSRTQSLIHSPRTRNRTSVIITETKAGSKKQSPRTTPKGTPSQSLQPSPMQSLSVTPIASPRSSGGATNYSNMAATVTSRSRAGSLLSVQPPTTERALSSPRSPSSPNPGAGEMPSPTSPLRRQLSTSGSSLSTLAPPSIRLDRRSGSMGTPLRDVLEKEVEIHSPQTGRESNNSLPSTNRNSGSSVHSHADEQRAEIERKKSEVLSLNSQPQLAPATSAASLHTPSAPNSKRSSRRTNTTTEWSEQEEELMRLAVSANTASSGSIPPLSPALAKESSGTSSIKAKKTGKQHRKAGTVFTASFMQPTLSSTGANFVPNTRDASATPSVSVSSTSVFAGSGRTPSFLQPTESRALKAVKAVKAIHIATTPSASRKPSISYPSVAEMKEKKRRKERVADHVDEGDESGGRSHRRSGSVDDGTAYPEEDNSYKGDAIPLQSNSPAPNSQPPELDHQNSQERTRAEMEALRLEMVQNNKDNNSPVISAAGEEPSLAPLSLAPHPPVQPATSQPRRQPWKPQYIPPSPATPAQAETPKKVRPTAPSLTEDELAHQAEIERVRAENVRRRKLKEQEALLEQRRLEALANDPAEQLRLRRERRKAEFRDRKQAEHAEELARKHAEEQRLKAEAERRRIAQEEHERAEAERIAAEGRADTERRIAARAQREEENRLKIIAEYERKRAEEAEALRLQEEADRIANMPKYLATVTVSAAARMLESQKVTGRDAIFNPALGETAAEYLEKMRSRTEIMRENAAVRRRELQEVKLNALHEKEDQLAQHIADIRRNKAELFEAEKAELELKAEEKNARTQQMLKIIQDQSEADAKAKSRELEAKIATAKAKLHANEFDRAREVEQIYREHEEEAKRRAEEVALRIENLKLEKARENELMLQKARMLKEVYLEQQEEEMRNLVETREMMREKASSSNSYTPKVGIDYFASNDLLHLAGLPANHPMMLQAGVSRIDENGNAVWTAPNQSTNFVVTNVGSSAPATFASIPEESRGGLDSFKRVGSSHTGYDTAGTPLKSRGQAK